LNGFLSEPNNSARGGRGAGGVMRAAREFIEGW
jgi:hypothetical protein